MESIECDLRIAHSEISNLRFQIADRELFVKPHAQNPARNVVGIVSLPIRPPRVPRIQELFRLLCRVNRPAPRKALKNRDRFDYVEFRLREIDRKSVV